MTLLTVSRSVSCVLATKCLATAATPAALLAAWLATLTHAQPPLVPGTYFSGTITSGAVLQTAVDFKKGEATVLVEPGFSIAAQPQLLRELADNGYEVMGLDQPARNGEGEQEKKKKKKQSALDEL